MLPGRGGREKSVEILKGWQRLLQPCGAPHRLTGQGLMPMLCCTKKKSIAFPQRH